MTITNDNPCGLNEFAFLEFSAPDPGLLHQQFIAMGFNKLAIHSHQDITLYEQGNVQFIVNNSRLSQQAKEHATSHGAGACAMGFRVENAKQAFDYALNHGAVPFQDSEHAGHGLPAIQAIGGSVIYFVDDAHKPFMGQWQFQSTNDLQDCGLISIDHLTHNVYRGNMDKWANFYMSIFNFKEIRYFDIVGKMTGLISRALASPGGNIKIPLNESKDDNSQIEEFLRDYHGEGIQHIALKSSDIYQSVHALRTKGVAFLDVPDTYYETVNSRVPWYQEPINKLQQERILIDGEVDPSLGLLLQIFTENVFGPVFFEIIQRHGNQGFGEGNFQALFEAIERDQVKRGILQEKNY